MAGNIAQYNMPVGDVPKASDVAVSTAREVGTVENRLGREAGDAIGGAISKVGGQLGDVVDSYHASQAIGHGAASFATLYGNLNQTWNETAAKADPNDQSISQGFKEHTLEPSIQQFLDGFQGQPLRAQEWAQTQADNLRMEMTKKMGADMSTRAGLAINQNIDEMTKNFAHSLQNDSSSLAMVQDSVASSIGAMVDHSPNLSATEAARIKAELIPKIQEANARAAFYGDAQRNPDAARAELLKEDGKYSKWASQEDINHGLDFADKIKRAQWEDQQHANETADRAQRLMREGIQNDLITQVLSGKNVSAQVQADARLSPAERENVINFQHEHTRQLRENIENQPHPAEFRSLMSEVFDTARNNPNALSLDKAQEMYKAGKLNYHEYSEIDARIRSIDKPYERLYNNQIMTIERGIRQMPDFAGDPNGASQVINHIDMDAHMKVDEYRKAGKDPSPLFDPASKDYLFTPEKLSVYVAPTQTVAEKANAARAGAQPGSTAPPPGTAGGFVTRPQGSYPNLSLPPASKGGAPAVPAKVAAFANEAALKKANPPSGTYMVGGRRATYTNPDDK